jgi:hypothetical protein
MRSAVVGDVGSLAYSQEPKSGIVEELQTVLSLASGASTTANQFIAVIPCDRLGYAGTAETTVTNSTGHTYTSNNLPAAGAVQTNQISLFSNVFQTEPTGSANNDHRACYTPGLRIEMVVDAGAVQTRSGQVICGWIKERSSQSFEQLQALPSFNTFPATSLVDADNPVLLLPPYARVINDHAANDTSSYNSSIAGFLVIWGVGLPYGQKFTFKVNAETLYFGSKIAGGIDLIYDTHAVECILTCWSTIMKTQLSFPVGKEKSVIRAIEHESHIEHARRTPGGVVSSVWGHVKKAAKWGFKELVQMVPAALTSLLAL